MSGAIQPDFSGASGAINYNMYFESVDPSGQISDTIIANEKSRIDLRAPIIDLEYDIKLRRDHFKKSETLKKNAYHRMLMIFINTTMNLNIMNQFAYMNRDNIFVF